MSTREKPPRRGNGPRVLVVDDEPQILRALKATLQGAGYEVTTAATAEEALRLAAVQPPVGLSGSSTYTVFVA